MQQIKSFFHSSRRSLAKLWLSHMPALQIAVTGSQGKTAVSQTLATILQRHASTVVTDVNLDTIYNVPITALRVGPWTKYAVFELGIDMLGEMDSHLQIVHPDIGIVTAVGKVHTDAAHMGSYDNVYREKIKLPLAVPATGTVFLNYSDPKVREMAGEIKAKVIWYGRQEDYLRDKPQQRYYGYSDVHVALAGTSFTLHDNGNNNEQQVATKLLGAFHAQTLSCVYGVLEYLNPAFINGFQSDVDTLTPLDGRMSLRTGPNESVILDDSLRANPDSTIAGLQTFAQIPYDKGRKIAIMANMGELERPEDEHRKIGEIVAKMKFDHIFCLGSMQKFTAEAAISSGTSKDQVSWYPAVEDGKETIKNFIRSHDFIYLKGSKYSYVGRVFE